MCAKRNKMYTLAYFTACCGMAVSQSPNSMQPWYFENNLEGWKWFWILCLSLSLCLKLHIFNFRIAESSWFSWQILNMNLVVDWERHNFAKDRETSEARLTLTTYKTLRGMKYMILQHNFTITITFIIQSNLFLVACPTRNNQWETNIESRTFFVLKKVLILILTKSY